MNKNHTGIQIYAASHGLRERWKHIVPVTIVTLSHLCCLHVNSARGDTLLTETIPSMPGNKLNKDLYFFAFPWWSKLPC